MSGTLPTWAGQHSVLLDLEPDAVTFINEKQLL